MTSVESSKDKSRTDHRAEVAHVDAVTNDGTAKRRSSDLSLLEVINVVIRGRWLMIWLSTCLVVLAIFVSIRTERTYTASASFVGTWDDGSAALRGLSAQLGISLPSQRGPQSPQFYVDLIRSREVLRQVVESEYTIAAGGTQRTGSLVEIWEMTEGSQSARLESAILRLREALIVRAERWETGIVTLTVTTHWADLSQQVAERILYAVNDFNLERRQSRAAAEREFVQARLELMRGELRSAEDNLQSFLESNRLFQNAPSLIFEHDRLQRRVAMQQHLVTALAQAFEEARIQEVRDIPVITTIDTPTAPVNPDGRGLRMRAIIALLLGFAVGMLIALGREFSRRNRHERPDDFEDFVRLRNEVFQDIRRPWRHLSDGTERLRSLLGRKSDTFDSARP